MSKQLGHPWSDAVQALENARDILLASSQQAGTLGDWSLVRKLVDLAERTDLLREEVRAVASGEARAAIEPPVQSLAPAGVDKVVTVEAVTEPDYPRFWVR